MKKKLIVCLLCLLCTAFSVLRAQELHFRHDGTFRIVQFTDTHVDPQKQDSKVAIQVVKEILEVEQPDLVILTGDVVTGQPALEGWQMILTPLRQAGIPFVVLNGNHDTEQDLTYLDIANIVSHVPNCLNVKNDKGRLSDQVLEVKAAEGVQTKALLYCMDSQTYSKLKQVEGYGWFSFDQVGWYRRESSKYTRLNGDNPLPALAFFHIPLPEYVQAFTQKGVSHTGIRLEHECPPDVNSGMFTAMLEQGDVMGMFVGHDHDNDYLVPYYGIAMGYGRFSGGKTTYIDLQPGARVITLQEGRRDFSTYIRLKDGRIFDRYSLQKGPEQLMLRPVDTSSWMKEVADSVHLCKLSVPATHDSGALLGGKDLQTQDLSIAEQLALGVRGFDIRLQARLDGKLGVYHSVQYQQITWDEQVWNEMEAFLRKHPSETLIVSLKREGGSEDDYRKLLAASLSKKEKSAFLVKDFHAGLTLGECRGKILLIHRDSVMPRYAGVLCFGWLDNVTCEVTLRGSNGKEAVASVEDQYQYQYVGKAPYKTAVTLANITAATQEPVASDKWFLSFASATALPTDGPVLFAERVNPTLVHELKGIQQGCGIVWIDFAGTTDGRKVVDTLIRTNLHGAGL